jgi:hypothetical protein
VTRTQVEGTIEREVEVAPIPGVHSDEPLDLGTMSLKLEVKKLPHCGAAGGASGSSILTLSEIAAMR